MWCCWGPYPLCGAFLYAKSTYRLDITQGDHSCGSRISRGCLAATANVRPWAKVCTHDFKWENLFTPFFSIDSLLHKSFYIIHRPVVHLYMGGDRNLAPVPSRNIIIDLVGWEYPDEFVLVSGHGDSWDNSEGAMDDGGNLKITDSSGSGIF